MEQARERFGRRGRQGRSRLLAAVCALCGYERKHAIKVLGGSRAMTDVHTQWTETRAVANRGQHVVQGAIAEVEAMLPFAILGFDTDNGGEFLNWHLVNYFRQRPSPVGFTRSRPYRKNDTARVEQENWTHVRQLVGYVRLEGQPAAALLDDLYRHEWGWLRNFFCPVMKQLRTEVTGSRKKRIYD